MLILCYIKDEDWAFKNIVEIPDEVLSKQIRRLLVTQPTAELDRSVKSKHNYFNSPITLFNFSSKKVRILTVKNKELEKFVYTHLNDLNLLNFADRFVCPIQPIQTDLTKF